MIDGIEYPPHALERMAPVGLIFRGAQIESRGVPPSVVAHTIRYGIKSPGREPGTVVHTFENVRVVTTRNGRRVITVIKIGR